MQLASVAAEKEEAEQQAKELLVKSQKLAEEKEVRNHYCLKRVHLLQLLHMIHIARRSLLGSCGRAVTWWDPTAAACPKSV